MKLTKALVILMINVLLAIIIVIVSVELIRLGVSYGSI